MVVVVVFVVVNIYYIYKMQNFVLDQISGVYTFHCHFFHINSPLDQPVSCQHLKRTFFITAKYLLVARKLSAELQLEFSRPAHCASPFRSSN